MSDKLPLNQAVAAAWAELGPDVRPLGKHSPTKRTWSTLFPRIFREVRREGGGQTLFTQKVSHELVSPATAELVRATLLRHGDQLARTARWKAAMDAERKRHRYADREEAVLREGWRLAEEGREPDAATVAATVRALLRVDRQREPLREYLADPVRRAELGGRIQQRWAGRDWPGPGPSQGEQERAHRLVELTGRRLPPGTTVATGADAGTVEAEAVFARAVAGTDGTLARHLMHRAGDTGLSETSPPPMPVVGTYARDKPVPPALERSIAERLGRWDERNPDVPSEWPDFVGAEVDRATSALGLSESTSRLLLGATIFLAHSMNLDPEAPRTPGIAGRLESAALKMPSVGWAQRQARHQAEGAGIERSASATRGREHAGPAAADDALADLYALPREWVGDRLWNGFVRAERLGRPIGTLAEFSTLLWRTWNQACRDYAKDRGTELAGRDTQAWRHAQVSEFVARARGAGRLDPALLEMLQNPFDEVGRMRSDLRQAWARLRAAMDEDPSPTARDVVLWLRANRRR